MTTSSSKGHESPSLVVGVGASAGGLDACRQLLTHVPPDCGLAFVVVLHLDPTKESHLAEILASGSGLPVTQVTQTERMEPGHVYVIAPNTSLEILDGEIRPGQPLERKGGRQSVDHLFATLARGHGRDAVAVVLSGLGSDGSAGLEDIKAAGGLCIAQDPETAEHSGMPRSAIATGLVDAVLAPEAIAGFLLGHARELRAQTASGKHPPALPPAEPATGFARILDLLAKYHGLDPRDYKEGTLRRRAERRLNLMSFSDWSEYAHYLEDHPDELAALYRDVLVGVTQFFRDPPQWEYLERELVPRLLDERSDPNAPVRVWSAGCATGEEAYGLAMVLLEQLDERESSAKLQVFATDVSIGALAVARRGIYPASIARDVPPRYLAQFFTEHGESYQVTQRVRDVVTLARHDLLTEPPFCRLDLVSCRNLFIYLEPHAQQDCIQRFHFSLRPRGVLWLGSSESINRQTDLFSMISAKYRLYRKIDVHRHDPAPWNIRMPSPSSVPSPAVRRSSVMLAARNAGRLTRSVERYVLERHASPCVVINQVGHVLHMFGPTADYLMQPRGEVRLDLLSWVQPGLYAKLRPALETALKDRETVQVTGAQVQRGPHSARVSCTIEPISSVAEGLFLVTFRDDDVTSAVPTVPPPDPGPEGGDGVVMRQLTQQLQETQEELRNALEELDNSNEEYRASYEELVSLNEELQSSNEELETTKEEAQSINEELLMVNRELEERNNSLRSVNADLENLLAVTTIPTIFLDRQLRVRRFTPAAERVMYLVPSDVDRPLEHIKRRVDDPKLLRDAAQVLERLVPVEAEVRSDDGRWYTRRVVPFRSGNRIEGVCMTFYDVTPHKLATEQSEEARHVAEAIVRSSRLPFVVLDHELTVVSANEAFYDAFAIPRQQGEGWPLHALAAGQWDIAPLREVLQRVTRDKTGVQDFELQHTFEGLGPRNLHLNASLMERAGRMPLILLAIEDVTPLREAQSVAQRRAEELEQEHRRKDEFLAMLGHELRNPLAALVNGLAIVEQSKGDPAQLRAIHPMLVRQTTRMTVMLDQLLDISRVISGKIKLQDEPVDLVEVADAAVEAVRPMISAARHDLVVRLPPRGTVLVRGDLVRLIQVVENLLSNAAKYTEDGGTIWLLVDAEDGSARMIVRDTGVGIDAELLTHIFDVFTQGSQSLGRAKGGLGLGLPLVRLLVGMHGGQVEASSPGPGQGSEFVVRLPRLPPQLALGQLELGHEESSDEPRDESSDELALATNGVPRRRVLVVDDEYDAAETLAALLEVHGHEARAVYDGLAAVETARTFQPDVVLLDLGLPDIDGYEVAKRLRAQEGPARTARLVALTGYQRDGERLRAAGFDEHMIKPLDLQRLAAMLAEGAPAPAPAEDEGRAAPSESESASVSPRPERPERPRGAPRRGPRRSRRRPTAR